MTMTVATPSLTTPPSSTAATAAPAPTPSSSATPPPQPPPTPPPIPPAEHPSKLTVDPLLFATLQQFWHNYSADVNDDSETDLELKQHWLRLFLCYFQFVSDEQLECDEAFQSFFNLIPEEICSFLLERVYEIISKSDLFSPSPPSPPPKSLPAQSTSASSAAAATAASTRTPSTSPHANTNDQLSALLSSSPKDLDNAECMQQALSKRARHTVRLLRKKHNFAQLILSAPSDCSKIVALRNFLTHQLGQHLLQFLLRVDIKLIASQKSLCDLCVNLFPNCSWGGADCAALTRANIFTYVGNLSLFYHQQPRPQRIISQKPMTKTKLSKTVAAATGAVGAVDVIAVTHIADCGTAFNASTKSSDEIADMLVRLLAKCVANECESTLSEQSISVTALNFALDALRMPVDAFVGGSGNEVAVKLRLLRLVELSLNNLFANAENVAAIHFPYVFVKLAAALESNGGSDTDILYALIFIIFGVLHNLVAVYSSRNPNMLGSGGGVRSLYDLKLIDAGVVDACVQALQHHAASPTNWELRQLFGSIFSMLLRIIDHLNDYDRQHALTNGHAGGHANHATGGGGATLQRLRAARRKSSWRQQHCLSAGVAATPTLSCSFQGALLSLLPHLSIEVQQLAVRYLMRAGTCCCHYTLATYECCLRVAVHMAAAYQRCAYKFLHRKLLNTVLVNEDECSVTLTTASHRQHQQHHQPHHQRPHHHSYTMMYTCSHCENKAKSKDFHAGLLALYRQFYQQQLAEPIANGRVTALCIFLQHLRSITQLLTHDLAAGVLAEIVLPIFRQQKAAIVAKKSKGKSKTSESTAPPVQARHHERLLHECLCIFAAYLNDIRLIKAFYNEENIAHLEKLLAVPALIRDVCDLIKLGIDNLTFLGDTPAEQARLSRRLITLQLESSQRAAQIFQALLKRLKQRHAQAHELWLDEVDDCASEHDEDDGDADDEDLYHKSRLSALDTLNIVSLQWTLNYELLRTSHIFCQEFAKVYAVSGDDDEEANAEQAESRKTGYAKTTLRQMSSTSAASYMPQSIAEVLKLNFNALHCFLLLPPQLPQSLAVTKDVAAHDNDTMKRRLQHQQSPHDIFNTHIYMVTPTTPTRTTFSEATECQHNAIDCSLEAFVISNMPPPPPPHATTTILQTAFDSFSTYATAELCSVCADFSDAALDSVATTTTSYENSMNSYDSLMERCYTTCALSGDYSFLNELQTQPDLPQNGIDDGNVNSDSGPESILIYDIRRQQHHSSSATAYRLKNGTVAPLTASTSSLGNSMMSSSALAAVGCSAASAVSSEPANQSILGKLFRMFGTLLTTALGDYSSNGATPAPPHTPTPEEIERERRLADEAAELRECFYQTNGDGKKLLLKLFEATMAICVKAYQNEKVEKMDFHLSKLKAIILSNANTNWSQHAEQQHHTPRDNPVLQTLQALLRIAEIAENDVQQTQTTPAAAAVAPSTQQAPTSEDDVVCDAGLELSSEQRQRDEQQQTLLPPTQPRGRTGSYLLPPATLALTKHNDISGYGMRTNAVTILPPTQVDSDADDVWSDCERESQLPPPPSSVFYANDGEYEYDDDEDVEGGYEADAEVPGPSDTDAEATTAADVWTAYTPASRYRTHVLHSGLCRLVVELLMELSEHCVRQPTAALPGWCDSLEQLANRLFVIRDCLGGSLYLLRGFAPLLTCNDPRLSDLQESILKLVSDLLTPDLLCAYFSLLAAPSPPVDILVKYLHYNRITPLRKAQASVELDFPIIIDGKCISTADPRITMEIERVRNYHLHQQAQTPFTHSPCIIPLTHERLWGQDGVTLSLWLQANAPTKHKSSSQLNENEDTLRSTIEEYPRTHVISIGTNLVMLSIYVNSNMQLVFETCRPNGDIQTPSASAAQSPPAPQKRNSISVTANTNSNATNHIHSVVDEEAKAAYSDTTTPSPFRNAINQTKALLNFRFNQMHIFQSNGHGSFSGGQHSLLDATLGGTTSYYEGNATVLQPLRLTRQRWTHLVFAVQTQVDSIELTVLLDGLDQYSLSLPFRDLRQLLRAHHAFQVIALGDGVMPAKAVTPNHNNSNINNTNSHSPSSASSNTYSGSHTTLDVCTLRCSISTVLLFNRRIDNRLIVANLTALGPNYCELTACQVGGWKPNYGYLNVSRLQRAHFGSHAEALKQLRQARILSYTAQQPDCALAYKDGIEQETVTYGHPTGLILYGELLQQQVPSLQTATILSGGLATLLYLFARVVELNATPTTQAMALDMLLSVAHADAQLYAEFQRQDYANLIGYVVRTEHCAKDAQLLRAIINNACTLPVIFERSNNKLAANISDCDHLAAPPSTSSDATNTLYVQENTVSCLVYPRLIVAVLQRYADWHSSGSVDQALVLEMLLHSVLALTRDKHPNRDFNMEQLSRAGFVRQLLNLCKVHLIEAPNPIHMSVTAARAFTNVLAVFAGSPPSPSLMDEIMKLLLLLHRAAESFVTHDRGNFYFLLSAAKPPSRERSSTAAQLSNRVANSVFQRRSHPGVAKPVPATTSSKTNSGSSELDPERAARIERLRRLHMQRHLQSGGSMYRRALCEFDDTLQMVADCTRLNRNALRLLNPTEVTRWRIKYKRAVAVNVTPRSPKMLQRTRLPLAEGVGGGAAAGAVKTRLNATMLASPGGPSSGGGCILGSPHRSGRKRTRLQSISTPKRLRTRAERNSDSSLQSLAATLALAAVQERTEGENGSDYGVHTPRTVNLFSRRRNKTAQHYKKTNTATLVAHTSPSDFHSAPGVVALQEGLLTLLKDFLYLLPDTAVEEVLKHYVKLEFLLVLANHRSCGVRAAIIRLLAALTKRLPAVDVQVACTKLYYAHHVANQLAIHATDAAMFLACIEWVTGLYGGTIEAVLAHMDGLRVQHRFGINALLAVTAKSANLQTGAGDMLLPLAAAAFKVLRNIFLVQPEEQATLLEAGLLQCCTRALYNLYDSGGGGGGSCCVKLSPIAVTIEEAVLQLLGTMGAKALKSAGQINLLWDILSMLAFYQERQPAAIVCGFRAAQAQLLLQLLQIYFGTAQLTFSMGGFKVPPLSDCTLPASEVRARFDLLIDRCAQFFTAQNDVDILVNALPPMPTIGATGDVAAPQPLEQLMPSEHELRLFELLATYGIATNQRCNNFIAWGLLPSRPRELRAFIVDALWCACRNDSLPAIICDGKMLRSLLLLCLLEDLEQPIVNLEPLCVRLGIHENELSMLGSVETEHERVRLSARAAAERRRTLAEKTAYKYETLAASCYESALLLTRRINEMQSAERKLIISHLRDSDETASYAQWLDIIRRMTHEGAAWHSAQHAENSWELDDTEGPSRVHTRLRRCHLDIDARFRMQDYADSPSLRSEPVSPPHVLTASETSPPLPSLSTGDYKRPLDYLLAAGYDQQLNIAWNAQQVLHNFPAKYLPVDGEIDGELLVTEQRLYFIAMHRCRYFRLTCDVASISEIWLKRYQHQEKAFEIFLDSNRSMLFSLQHQEDWRTLRELFCDKIVAMPDANKLLGITQQWREGMLTNWEYLMTLNQLSGRTYNDLMQYPVFPWILSNYTSDVLDLTDTQNYRLLHKPIAVQHEANEQHFINNYAYINSTVTNMGSMIMKPYHYSSHYSNSGTVLHFLVRVPPFTSYFLRYQDNNFDLPDRTFHALNTTWNLASRDSSTDVKELIPEFFCLSEMFENFENLNFGCRQSGERVEDVQLPPWCRGDARLFVLIHRQALESEAVRYKLHSWIDLIFGYKQMGDAAVEAINVFHPATYPIFLESEEIRDPIERKAVETMVRTYGQMPRQLFKAAHPASRPLSYSLGQPEQVLGSVRGLRWGVYAGSPQLSPPQLGNIYELLDAERLIAFPGTNVVYGLRAREHIMQGAELDTYNVVSWGHCDRIVRIEPLNKRPYTRPRNLLHNDSFDEITACGTDPNCNQLWFGHRSGRISVYRCNTNDCGNVLNGSRLIKSRQSYVRGLYLSYNSAFRKITNATASNAKASIRGGGSDETDCDESTDSVGGIGTNNSAAAITNSSTSAGDASACGGGTSAAQHRENTGTDLVWSGPAILIRHTDEITCIALSVEFKIAVTAGRDGMAVIWDLNDWRYVRTIERPAEIHQSPISLIAISPTLGDIVTVHTIPPQSHESTSSLPTAIATADECFEVTEENHDDFVKVSVNPNGKSILRLHTVNARYIQHVVHEDRILAVCFSYIKEGVGVNCIATAIEGGIVRLWSSWNLNLITEIPTGTSDIVSLTYSTHQHLVVLTRKSRIQVWETDGLYGTSPKFPQIAYK